MACVVFLTGSLAMEDAERFLPQFFTKLEAIMSNHALGDDEMILRIIGCPNACGRAMLPEIVLCPPESYRLLYLYLPGDRMGTCIPRMYGENITKNEILAIIDDTVGPWGRERYPNESYEDYVMRIGIVSLVIDSAHDFYD